jgi:hypothetical protein
MSHIASGEFINSQKELVNYLPRSVGCGIVRRRGCSRASRCPMVKVVKRDYPPPILKGSAVLEAQNRWLLQLNISWAAREYWTKESLSFCTIQIQSYKLP